jgi:hypothetical protein
MKRMAIFFFVNSLFASPRKCPDWSRLMVFARILIALLMLALRWAN